MDAVTPVEDVCAQRGALLSIEEAIARVRTLAPPIDRRERAPLVQAVGRTLAVSLRAATDQPLFDQSAMDGYAVCAGPEGIDAGAALRVTSRTAAGDAPSTLPPGAAIRIFTGGPLPRGADAVVMQEHGTRTDDVFRPARPVREGADIRRRGEDIRAGELLLDSGALLDARHVALCAAQGVGAIDVLARPRVAVVSTGNELREAGAPLGPGTVHDVNRPMLLAALRARGIAASDAGIVRDEPGRLADRLRALAADHDLVVTSGGASVGEEDHTTAAIRAAGGVCETLRIALKPGKPAVAGRIGAAMVLGLPGNPVSALVSFMLLGEAALAALDGRRPRPRLGYPLPLVAPFARRPGRREFAPASLLEAESGLALAIIGRGGSARLRPLGEADGLAEIAPEHAPVRAGDVVAFHPFPTGHCLGLT